MNTVFMDIYKTVWGGIFPSVELFGLEDFEKFFTKGIILPQKYQSEISGSDLYCNSDYGYKRFISESEIGERMNKDNYMESKEDISGLTDILKKMGNLALFQGSKTLNSDVVEQSDNVYSSSYIFRSSGIQSCQKVMFCQNMGPSEYLMASKNSKDCSFGIRIIDSAGVSNSFDVSFSGRSSNCYFCHDCYDLRDCMFCFHLTSKQYCIGNMQFEEQEYKQLKEKILKEYFGQLKGENAFRDLSDL